MKLTTYFLSFFLFLSLLLGCKDDEVINPIPPDTSKPPVADAGNDTTLVLGGKIILDGTASNDPADKSLTYSWSVKTKPEGSTAAVENGQEVKAYFTPDLAGTYTFELAVNNGSLTAKDEVKATITHAAYAGCVLLDENITEVTTLSKIAPEGQVDYCVKEDIGIYARLTIEAGVIIEFEENKKWYIDGEGELIAKGNEANRIIFTGKNKEKGFWKGIEFSSTDSDKNLLEYCEISYAGSGNHVSGKKAGISLRNGAMITLKNSTISQSGGYGMVIPHGSLHEFANNTFLNNQAAALYITADVMGKIDGNSKFVGANGRDGVEVKGASIRSEEELIWPALADGAKYYILDQMNLYTGVKVQEGAVFEFAYNSGLYIDGENAYFIAKGTAAKPIIFTGIDKEAGYWKGIEFSSTVNMKNHLDYCQVTFAGSDEHVSGFKAGITARNSAKFSITNTVVKHSGGYGIAIDNGTFEKFENNLFESNASAALRISASVIGKLDASSRFTGTNGLDGVEVSGASVRHDAEQLWPAFADGSKYRVLEDVRIYTGIKIQEGSIFEFASNTQLYVDGGDAYLQAIGTADKKIIFTGVNKTAGFWKGIEFSSTSGSKNELRYCEVSFGGSANHVSGYKANISIRNGAEIKLYNSSLSNSAGYGIAIASGSVNTDDAKPNTYSSNALGDTFPVQ